LEGWEIISFSTVGICAVLLIYGQFQPQEDDFKVYFPLASITFSGMFRAGQERSTLHARMLAKKYNSESIIMQSSFLSQAWTRCPHVKRAEIFGRE
jgi:hypothetical protein